MIRLPLICAATLVMAFAPGAATPPSSVATRPAAAWETLKTEHYPGKRDDISFSDAKHGWYGTGKGDLFATTDGGDSWTRVASKPGTFIRALGFVDAKTGFIGNVGVDYYPGVTDTVPLYRTDDGGVTWTAVNLHGASVAGICAIDILRSERVYQGQLQPRTIVTAAGRVGGPAAIVRSTDGGATWRVIDMSKWTGMILDVHFIDEQTGFVAASSSRDIATTNAQILMTRDGGDSWREVYRSARPTELIWKMSFPTPRIGYGTVMSYDKTNPHRVIVKSVDGGRSWREMPVVENAGAIEFGVGFTDASHGWVGTGVGGFETSDGGKTFVPTPIAKAANKIRVVKVSGGGAVVYAIGTEVQRMIH